MLIVHIFNEIRKELDIDPLFQLSREDVQADLDHGREEKTKAPSQ